MDFFVRLERKEDESDISDRVNAGPYDTSYNKSLAHIMLDNFDIMTDKEKYKEWYARPSEDRILRPGPYEDNEIRPYWRTLNKKRLKASYVFGFRNLKSYRKWFSNEIGRELAKEQARLAIYKVNNNSIDNEPNVIHGQKQSIARVECLELVKTIPVTSKGYLGQYLKSIKKKLKKSC